MLLNQVKPGTTIYVALSKNEYVAAEVVSQGTGSVTVLMRGSTVTWSPLTPVHLSIPGQPPQTAPAPPIPETRATSQPAKQIEPGKPSGIVGKQKATPATPQPATPAPKGKDQFGVKLGSAAAKVNEILLRLKKDVTVDAVLKEDSTLVKSNVRSHLKRMAKDGLIACKTKGEELFFSVLSTSKKKVKS